MKKLMTVLLIISMIFTSTFVYAETRSPGTTKDKLELLKEVRNLAMEASQNHNEINRLKADSKIRYDKAKTKIAELLEQKDSLTAEQLNNLKDIIVIIKENKPEVSEVLDQYDKDVVRLRQAKKINDLKNASEVLESLISVQKRNIRILNEVIQTLNRINIL